MEKQRKFCPSGVSLANQQEVTSGVPDSRSPEVRNTQGERLLLTAAGGENQIVNPDGACAFETLGENLDFVQEETGVCSFCIAKCSARKVL